MPLNKKHRNTPYKPQKVLTERQAQKEPVGSFYHPTEKTIRTGICPKGFIEKNHYHRSSYNKKSGKHINETNVGTYCARNKGMPGKILPEFKVLPKLEKNALKKYGYSTKLNAEARHKSLLNAAKNLSYSSVTRRLVVLRSYNKTANKRHAQIYNEDIKKLQAWRKENPNLYKKKSSNSGSNKTKSVKVNKNNKNKNVTKNVSVNKNVLVNNVVNKLVNKNVSVNNVVNKRVNKNVRVNNVVNKRVNKNVLVNNVVNKLVNKNVSVNNVVNKRVNENMRVNVNERVNNFVNRNKNRNLSM